MGNAYEDQQVAKPYRVLSLDGGGMRGIYTAAFLARLPGQFSQIRAETQLSFGRRAKDRDLARGEYPWVTK